VAGGLRALRHLGVLFRIAALLSRHDALFPLRRVPLGPTFIFVIGLVARKRPGMSALRPGERLALAFQQLGPSFIKLGQALSTRSDLVGETMAADLSGLQDRLPPFPTEAAIAMIEAELELPIASIFRSFESQPVAAASVAQVHFAVTADGRDVAVKVLRPGVADAFARDLDLLLWLAQIGETLQPALRRLKPIEVVGQLQESVQYEMDLRLEAAAAAELAQNFRGDPQLRIPAVDWSRTGKRVMTLERIHGIPVDERDRLIAAGHEPREIVRKAASLFFSMVFRDGFFHADLHPGNLFVAEDGAIIAIDFGIMGRLDRKHRYFIADILLAFLIGDYRRVAQVHFDAGFVPATESLDGFTQACRSIGEPLLERPLEQISIARLLSQLFEVTSQFRMETQPQLLMLQKTMVLAEGLGRSLDPSVNMWHLSRPLIEDWMRLNRSGPARAMHTLADLVGGLERLPALLGDVERTLQQLGNGGLKLHPDTVRGMTGQRGPGLALALPLWVAAAALCAIALHYFRS
jgi:ubiquinone biosynthesis protein